MDAGRDDQRILRVVKKTVESTRYSKNGLIDCVLMKSTVPSVAVIIPFECEVLDNIRFMIALPGRLFVG